MKPQHQGVIELREDVVTGELLIPIPEAIVNEMEWFEGSMLNYEVEGTTIIFSEETDDQLHD